MEATYNIISVKYLRVVSPRAADARRRITKVVGTSGGGFIFQQQLPNLLGRGIERKKRKSNAQSRKQSKI